MSSNDAERRVCGLSNPEKIKTGITRFWTAVDAPRVLLSSCSLLFGI